jgi:hypothetical protein
VDDGPDNWQRIEVQPDPARAAPGRVEVLNTRSEHERREIAPYEIDPTAVRLEQDSISFEVPEEAIGRPVLVRVSYFPNWRVSGAEGPYRAAPNFMVVVPTSTSVKLSYGYAWIDFAAYGMTIVGIGLLVFFWRRRVVDFSAPTGEPSLEPAATVGAAGGESRRSASGDPWLASTADPGPISALGERWRVDGSASHDPDPFGGMEFDVTPFDSSD